MAYPFILNNQRPELGCACGSHAQKGRRAFLDMLFDHECEECEDEQAKVRRDGKSRGVIGTTTYGNMKTVTR